MYALFPVLAQRGKRTAGYLSGGEQQMLAMGRALMSRPRCLLLDEPSLGLAPMIVQQIRDLIVEINAGGTTVLLVEQNATMALSIADHGYVMENGKIVMDGPAAELLADEDVREFYLGIGGEGAASFREVKHYSGASGGCHDRACGAGRRPAEAERRCSSSTTSGCRSPG